MKKFPADITLQNHSDETYKAKLGGTGYYKLNNVSEDKCVLPVSIGNPNQDESKFAATLSMISKRKMQCDIILADTLQHHNLINIHSQNEALSISKRQGDIWLEKNKSSLESLNEHYKIVRWDECLTHPLYKQKLELVKTLYKENSIYQNLIKSDLKIFLERHNNLQNTCSPAISENISLNYIFEETAVLLSFFISKKYNFILYPSQIPSSIKFILENLIFPSYPNSLKPLKIYFKRTHSIEQSETSYESASRILLP